VGFVDIGEIVYHHSSNYLFITKTNAMLKHRNCLPFGAPEFTLGF
jgi:hypothetical protein